MPNKFSDNGSTTNALFCKIIESHVATGIEENIDLYIHYFSEKQHNKMAVVSRVLFLLG